MFTAIHRALGEAPGPLSWQMIKQLVDQQTEETADLDFKKVLPIGKGEWRDESAKDFAAMANSGGGVVLYGVAEERGRGTARSIEPFEFKEADLRTLTQVAYNLVHPPLMSVRPIKVADPENPDRGVLAMVVPPSADVPHMFWKRDAFLAPLRHGSDTRWMDERQIERAYRERFEGRTRRQLDLETFYADTLAHAEPVTRVGLVVVASPVGVGGTVTFPAEAEEAMEIFYSAVRGRQEFIRSDDSIFQAFNPSPSVGLRRWRWLPTDRSGKTQHLLELHRDGSVALVADINQRFLDDSGPGEGRTRTIGRPETSTLAVEFGVAGLGAFLAAIGKRLRNDDGYKIRAGLTWEAGREDQKPLSVYHSYGRLEVDSEPAIVRRFAPIEGLIRTRTSEELRTDLYLLCTDLLNQTGLGRICHLRAT